MEENDKYDMIFKIILVGDTGTGKTNILSKYAKNSFESNSKPTVGVEFFSKRININGKFIKMQIWDTAGQERYRSIVSGYFKDTKGFLIVYDITNKSSFNNIDKWINEIMNSIQNPLMILIGNKSDLNFERKVSIEEALEKAERHNCDIYEVSALDGKNIDYIFLNINYKILKKISQEINGKENIFNENENKVLVVSENNIENEESEESEKEDDKINKDLQKENKNKIKNAL